MSDLLQQLSKPASLASLVKIQQGTVVSKALIQKPEGTLTVFAFDQFQGLSKHTAPFDAIVTVLEGEADMTVEDEVFRVKNGESLCFPKGSIHAVDAVTPFKMSLVMIKA